MVEAPQKAAVCVVEAGLYVTLSGPGELVAFDVGVQPLALYPGRR